MTNRHLLDIGDIGLLTYFIVSGTLFIILGIALFLEYPYALEIAAIVLLIMGTFFMFVALVTFYQDYKYYKTRKEMI